jgi:hypothetical protein
LRKLIFVNRQFHPDHSAISRMLSDLAFALARDGQNEIHVVTSRQRYDDAAAQLSAFEKVEGVQMHRVCTSGFGRQNLLGRSFDQLSFYVTAFITLLKLADKHSIVIGESMAKRPHQEGIPETQITVLHNWADDSASPHTARTRPSTPEETDVRCTAPDCSREPFVGWA